MKKHVKLLLILIAAISLAFVSGIMVIQILKRVSPAQNETSQQATVQKLQAEAEDARSRGDTSSSLDHFKQVLEEQRKMNANKDDIASTEDQIKFLKEEQVFRKKEAEQTELKQKEQARINGLDEY